MGFGQSMGRRGVGLFLAHCFRETGLRLSGFVGYLRLSFSLGKMLKVLRYTFISGDHLKAPCNGAVYNFTFLGSIICTLHTFTAKSYLHETLLKKDDLSAPLSHSLLNLGL